MLVKKIRYTDYKGQVREEEFFFNYSRADASRLVMSTKEGLEEFLKRIAREEDRTKMFGFLEEFILKAYGEISADGRQFVKSDELSRSFSQTEAYSILLMELLDGGDKAISDFINAVVPKPEEVPQKNEDEKPALTAVSTPQV